MRNALNPWLLSNCSDRKLMIRPEVFDLNPVNLGTPDPQSQTCRTYLVQYIYCLYLKCLPLNTSEYYSNKESFCPGTGLTTVN